MIPKPRKGVIVTANLDDTPFKSFGLEHFCYDEVNQTYQFGRSSALILFEPPGRVGRIRGHLRKLFPLAENYGLEVYTVVATDACLNQYQAITEEFNAERKEPKSFQIFRRDALDSVAVAVVKDLFTRDCNPLQEYEANVISDSEVSESEKLLLRRAFYDCQEIRVERQSGGRTAASVFKAYVSTHVSGAKKPLPFFVKILDREKFDKELERYRLYISQLVPYYLRPNIVESRCVTGRPCSIIVQNMVQDALSIRESYRNGLGSGTIFSLFEVTLKGLRVQTYEAHVTQGSLVGFFEKKVEFEKISKSLVGLAGTMGLRSSLVELINRFKSQAASVHLAVGYTHNDLHCENVLVRRGDAILIDFGSVNEGPLSADPLTLEVSFVFDEPLENETEFEEWKVFVDSLYSESSVLSIPPPQSVPAKLAWLNSAVRELRHIVSCSPSGETEVLIVLAAVLIRHARNNQKREGYFKKQSAYALVVAERLGSLIHN